MILNGLYNSIYIYLITPPIHIKQVSETEDETGDFFSIKRTVAPVAHQVLHGGTVSVQPTLYYWGGSQLHHGEWLPSGYD
jgi:hypothetical protein